MIKYSIIVPAYNTENDIRNCLDSIVNQQPGNYVKEAIIIDDCSNDKTYRILSEYGERYKGWVKIFKNDNNLGLGLTRNVGLDHASGEWLIFLDSDDSLNDNALKALSEYIYNANHSIDVVGYNWTYDINSSNKTEKYGGRCDLRDVILNKHELLKKYLTLGMDSSVIYAAMKRSMIDDNKLRFRVGLHEDVDFLFLAYCYAKKIGALDLPLYRKNNRQGSIVNTISAEHIKYFFQAMRNIFVFLKANNQFTDEIRSHYRDGICRLLATEIRYIWQGQGVENRANSLYFVLYEEYLSLLKDGGLPNIFVKKRPNPPKYMMIADHYLNMMASMPNSIHKDISTYLDDLLEKSWSCYDLHNSVFLTPREIRTCCKRYFVNNQMKGDVPLLDETKYHQAKYTPENILREKQSLHVRINTGMTEECAGCPYLEFKKWPALHRLKIQYISFEYNTTCNMRCAYCSDKYYGGEKPIYDVELLIRQLFANDSLDSCQTFMWGGGEPALDKSFAKLINYMTSKYPGIRQRVFTNATIFSDTIGQLLHENKILTITSLDAGHEEVFYKIRKHKGLKDVLSNLKKYATIRPGNMLVKYIITKDNCSLDELRSFVGRVNEYSLQECNYQISYDFKEESVDLDSLVSAVALFTYLTDANVRFVFFDDLFWQRISDGLNAGKPEFLRRLTELDLLRGFATQKQYQRVVVWGAGIQAKYLIEKSEFFKKVKIEHFVDNAPEKIGNDYFGYKILSPDVLLSTDTPVLITGVQNIPNILDNYYRLGIKRSRLIRGLVI